MMARAYAPVRVSVWNDDDFIALTDTAQRVYFLINSQRDINYAGIVPYMPSRWAKLAKNTSAAKIRNAIAELAAARFVLLDQHTEELWVRSFIKHNGVLSSPNLVKAMKSAYENTASLAIKQGIWQQVPNEQRQGMTNPFGPKSPDPLREPFEEPFGEPFPEGQGLGSTDSLVVVEPEPETEPEPSSSNPDAHVEPVVRSDAGAVERVEEEWPDILTRWREASLGTTYDMRNPPSWRTTQRRRFLAEHGATVAAWLGDWPDMPHADIAARLKPMLEPEDERHARVRARLDRRPAWPA